MSGHKRLTDAEIEALLSGSVPDGLEATGDLIAQIRSLAAVGIDPAVADTHIAAAADVARSADMAGAVVPVGKTSPAWTRRKKRTVFAGISSTIAGKILAGTVAAVAATSTAAAAGVLPDSIQEVLDDNVIVVEEVQEMRRVRDQARVQFEEEAGDPAEVQTQEREQSQTNQGTQGEDEGTQNQYGQTDDQPGNQGDDPAQNQYGDGDEGAQERVGDGEGEGDGAQNQNGQDADAAPKGSGGESGQGGADADQGQGKN